MADWIVLSCDSPVPLECIFKRIQPGPKILAGKQKHGPYAIYLANGPIPPLPDEISQTTIPHDPDPMSHERLRDVTPQRDHGPLEFPSGFDPSCFATKDRLIALHNKAEILYVRDQRDFARWAGDRWQTHTSCQDLYEAYSKRVEGIANERVRSLKRSISSTDNRPLIRDLKAQLKEAERLREYATVKLRSNYHYNAVKGRLSEERTISVNSDALDANAWEINTPVGIVNLRTGETSPHDPTRMHSKITRAAPRDQDTPHFTRLLKQCTLDDTDLQRYLHLRIGSALIGVNLEQKGVIVYGEHGGGGKNTLFDAVSHALGDYAHVTAPDTFLGGHMIGGNRDDLVSLAGARIVTTSEPDDEGVLDVSAFKRMTGDAIISASAKFEKTRRFVPSWTPFILCNMFPALRRVGNPIWRRVEVVPFDWVVNDKNLDPMLPMKLQYEAQGILQWCIEGCLAWVSNGCRIGPLPQRMLDAVREYKHETDSVRAWAIRRIDLVANAQAPSFILHADYLNFCRIEGFRRPVAPQEFGRRLSAMAREAEDQGHEMRRSKDSKGRAVWHGLKLVT